MGKLLLTCLFCFILISCNVSQTDLNINESDPVSITSVTDDGMSIENMNNGNLVYKDYKDYDLRYIDPKTEVQNIDKWINEISTYKKVCKQLNLKNKNGPDYKLIINGKYLPETEEERDLLMYEINATYDGMNDDADIYIVFYSSEKIAQKAFIHFLDNGVAGSSPLRAEYYDISVGDISFGYEKSLTFIRNNVYIQIRSVANIVNLAKEIDKEIIKNSL